MWFYFLVEEYQYRSSLKSVLSLVSFHLFLSPLQLPWNSKTNLKISFFNSVDCWERQVAGFLVCVVAPSRTFAFDERKGRKRPHPT